MNLPLLTQLQADHTDADYLAALRVNIITYATTPVIVTHQTIRSVLTKRDPATAKAKSEAIAAVVAQVDPMGNQLLYSVGVDVNFPDAKALLDGLPAATGGLVTVDDCDAIRDLGRTNEPQWKVLGIDTQRAPEQADLEQGRTLAAVALRKDEVTRFYAWAVNTYLPAFTAGDVPTLVELVGLFRAYQATLPGEA